MLAEDRCKKILDILDSMGSVTVQQLMDELDTSESTIRRDLVAMDKKGYLTKVHGGAIVNNTNILIIEDSKVHLRMTARFSGIKMEIYARNGEIRESRNML